MIMERVLPISIALLFDYFTNPSKSEFPEAIINDFAIWGIILHDPEIHKEIDQWLNKDYNYHDDITGDKFLIFEIIESNNIAYNDKTNNLFYQWKDFLQKHKDLPKSFGQNKNINPTILFSTFLKIDINNFPVLLLTDDIKKGEWKIIKLNNLENDSIKKYFLILGNLVEVCTMRKKIILKK